uniref:Cartilage intermediate layer protein, nucleotide pyrophosphohydrolase n=1 Tax=Mus musculus TaxID=10090 RepID=D6RD06_MOUSE
MAAIKTWVFSFLVLEVTTVLGRQTMLAQSVRRVQPVKRTPKTLAKPADSQERNAVAQTAREKLAPCLVLDGPPA